MIKSFKEELEEFVLRLKKPLYVKKIPIRYNEKTGEPVEFEDEPVYPKLEDMNIGLRGNFEELNRVSRELKTELLKIWKPIIIDSEYLIYPVNGSSDGYDVRFYQLSNYINIGGKG